jgi:hypothetical protein
MIERDFTAKEEIPSKARRCERVSVLRETDTKVQGILRTAMAAAAAIGALTAGGRVIHAGVPRRHLLPVMIVLGSVSLAGSTLVATASPAAASARSEVATAYACPVLVAADAWPGLIGAHGVPVCNNFTTGPARGNTTIQVVPDGDPWQCVELAQRFWQAEGWYSGDFPGVNYAYQIWNLTTSDPSQFVGTPKGSLSSSNIHPGDLVVVNKLGTDVAGHVAVVVQVTATGVEVVEQNYPSGVAHDVLGEAWYQLQSGTLTRSGDARIVVGVVHSPKDRYPAGGSVPSSRHSTAAVFTGSSEDEFWGNTSGQIEEESYNGAWHGPAVLPSSAGVTTGPAAVVSPAGEDVFWGNASGQVDEESYYSGAWHAPHVVPNSAGVSIGPAVVFHAGSEDVFWGTASGQVDEESYYGGAWHAPHILPNSAGVKTGLAAVVAGASEDVFWGNASGQLEEESYYSGAWRAPLVVPNSSGAINGPAAVFTGGSEDEFWGNVSGQIEEESYNGGAWHGPAILPNSSGAINGPAAVYTGASEDEFWGNASGQIEEESYNAGAWHGPAILPNS